ncbi:hypothetical protein BD770DRAFT_397162 [Pilaira anomala]|nr:hypothetical protein BD770DRAFT_397162 [Pilaira anomala]
MNHFVIHFVCYLIGASCYTALVISWFFKRHFYHLLIASGCFWLLLINFGKLVILVCIYFIY